MNWYNVEDGSPNVHPDEVSIRKKTPVLEDPDGGFLIKGDGLATQPTPMGEYYDAPTGDQAPSSMEAMAEQLGSMCEVRDGVVSFRTDIYDGISKSEDKEEDPEKEESDDDIEDDDDEAGASGSGDDDAEKSKKKGTKKSEVDMSVFDELVKSQSKATPTQETAKGILGDFLEKAGPYIGPKGGKWADPQHKIPWDDKKGEGSKDPRTKVQERAVQWFKTVYGVSAEAQGSSGLRVPLEFARKIRSGLKANGQSIPKMVAQPGSSSVAMSAGSAIATVTAAHRQVINKPGGPYAITPIMDDKGEKRFELSTTTGGGTGDGDMIARVRTEA